MSMNKKNNPTPKERLDSKTVSIPFSGCHIWIGASVPNGYGVIYFEGRQQYTHRVSWQIANGEIPCGLYVLHHCDTPSCVNPDHLFLGTLKDNSRDMVKKGRNCSSNGAKGVDHHMYINGYKGEENHQSKLTWAQVEKIRELYKPGVRQIDLASMFGIKQAQISSIIRRQSWV